MNSKKGQVTIFIILAIIIVVGIILYFSLDISFGNSVPTDMRPVYDYYISCLQNEAESGISILGEQGGYIKVPDFEAGSSYAPFSSQLSFFGQPVPYWMYLSGNNILKEQVPSKKFMESELNDFMSEKLQSCDFSEFEAAGFDVYVEPGNVSTTIRDEEVIFKPNNKITIYKGDRAVSITKHEFSVKSKLGKFYDLAVKVYNKEKSTMFLEEYAIDTMRLYAPVDGVDVSCVPKVFNDDKIIGDLRDGLEDNINSIKLKGDYNRASSEERKYFVKDLGFDVDENANIMYNVNWPTKVEIHGDRIVNPVGTQAGLSALGFCYVPYHLVYDISFPVMIQFFDGQDLFQFPLAVMIDHNLPRKSISTYTAPSEESKVCEYDNSNISVHTYDSDLNPVAADLTFRCLDGSCDIGKTTLDNGDAVYSGGVPQCVNGIIVANAPGYAEAKQVVSTNSETVANILMKKKYNLDLILDGINTTAAVTFTSKDYSTTVVYPNDSDIELIEGAYNISVYVYGNTEMNFPGSQENVCVDVPSKGIGGLVGMTEEKCYDMNVPPMKIDSAVIGGGVGQEYITESMLQNANQLKLKVPLFDKPTSMEDLQKNYMSIETSNVYVDYE